MILSARRLHAQTEAVSMQLTRPAGILLTHVPMKKTTRLSLLLLLFCFSGTLQAFPPEIQMDWGTGPQNISGDSDVATDGTLVDAYALGDNTVANVSVNGVTFVAFNVPSDGSQFATIGNYTLGTTSTPLNNYSNLSSQEAPYGLLSSGYQTLLGQAGSTSSPGMLVLTINGLTVGQQYLFQFWTSNSPLTTAVSGNRFSTIGTAVTSINLVDNMTNTDGGMGQFAVGTFTAIASSEFMSFSGLDGSNDPAINAFQLRAIAVPEPASSVLLGLGLLAGSFFFRRRRLA
jgi:hypothetical protein